MAFTRMTRNQELVVAALGGCLCLAISPTSSIGRAIHRGFPGRHFQSCRVRHDCEIRGAGESSASRWRQCTCRFLRRAMDSRTHAGWALGFARSGIIGDGEALSDVIVFLFEGEDKFIARIDAESAHLEAGYWMLNKAVLISGDGIPSLRPVYQLTTDLTVDNIQDSFASPNTMSFWELPRFISYSGERGVFRSASSTALAFIARITFVTLRDGAYRGNFLTPHGQARWYDAQELRWVVFWVFPLFHVRSSFRPRPVVTHSRSFGRLDTRNGNDPSRRC